MEPLIHALLVEDDCRLAQLTTDYLQGHGIVVSWENDGIRGLDAAQKQKFDVVLLDLMLPGKNGLEICRQIRERSDIPVIILTARGEEADRVMGLEMGADDYLPKPFSPRELVARIHAVLRRTRGKVGPSSSSWTVGKLFIDSGSHRATFDGQELALTSYEFLLLHILAQRAGRILSREQLLDLAKGNSEETFDRSIDVHISRLRQKLGDDAKKPRILKTIRGMGYMLVCETTP